MARRLYSLLIACAVPVALGWLLWRGLRDPAYRGGLGERLGFGAPLDRPSIWVHAVSLGEVTAAAPLIHRLRTRHPGMTLVITTATPTGRARAASLFPEAVVRFAPYDTSGSVRRFLSRVRPRFAVIMETELWPNLFAGCRRRGVPVILANARLSERSMKSYRRLRALIRPVFAGNVRVAAQTEADAERFIEIGAPRGQVQVAGNVKFDSEPAAELLEQGRALRVALGEARPVWTAGSTHAGEDEQVLDAHRALLVERRDSLLVLAPRHPERFERVAELVRERGLAFERRSSSGRGPDRESSAVAPDPNATIQVLVLDTVGELRRYYAASDIVFVGGSLVPIGGHNLLEGAALGRPVLTGPSFTNARDVAELLLASGAALEVSDSHALASVLTRWFRDPAERARRGALGRALVEANQGAVERIAAIIGRDLDEI